MPCSEAGIDLADPAISPLNEEAIRSALTADAKRRIDKLEIHREIDSTNSYLMRQTEPQGDGARVCLAEQQTAGRGRRGRHWVSPFGASLYLSLAWRTALPATGLLALSPLSAIAVAQALRAYGARNIALKWPNDLYSEKRKLGGILLENSSNRTVIGIGINVAMPTASAIDQPWTDLQTILGHTPCRNPLAAGILNRLLPYLAATREHGLPPLRAAWAEFDAFAGCEIELRRSDGVVFGRADGINEQGALCVHTATGTRFFTIGDISLRQRS